MSIHFLDATFIILCMIGWGLAKGISDIYAHDKKNQSILKNLTGWWDSTWTRKYKTEWTSIGHQPTGGPRRHWWYLGLKKTKYAERFPYSTTALVFLTDPWHCFNWIQYRFIHMAVAFLMVKYIGENDGQLLDHWIWTFLGWTFVGGPALVGLTFETFYDNATEG